MIYFLTQLLKKQKIYIMLSPAIPSSEINHNPRIESIIFNAGRTKYDEQYEDIYNDYKKSVIYPNYIISLDLIFDGFIKNNTISNEQAFITNKALSYLQSFIYENPSFLAQVKIDKAVEDEVVIYRVSKKGIYNIVIDTDGDIMISFSGYEERGWRKFCDKDEFNPSEHIQDFFST